MSTEITDEQIIQEIKSWIGTPWAHGVALKGYKADCLQFIVEVYKNLNFLPHNFKTIKYNKDWALHNSESKLLEIIKNYGYKVAVDKLQVADVLLFNFGRCAHHAGLYIGKGKVVHTHIKHGITETLLKDLKKEFVSAWRINNR